MNAHQIAPLIPLSQSGFEDMACPDGYITKARGERLADSSESARGTEVHHIMSQYIDHCAKHKIASDWVYFDHLNRASGEEAAVIAKNMRDNYLVDWEHVYSTETCLYLSADFLPVNSPFEGVESLHDDENGANAAHAGTLDAIFLYVDEKRAIIDDFKSHFRPFIPDTFQSKLYPFLLMQHLKWLEEVEFRLRFVRYANADGVAIYRRSDLPRLAEEIRRARERQIIYHQQANAGALLPVLPGSHCQYCPKMANLTCRVKDFNPHTAVSIDERMAFQIWSEKARAVNSEVLREYVEAHGEPHTYRDANNNQYQAGFHDKDSEVYPAVKTVEMLQDWVESTGEDAALLDAICISSTAGGFKSKLKAKKRAPLHQRMKDEVVQTKTKVTFGIKDVATGDIDDGAPKYGEEWE